MNETWQLEEFHDQCLLFVTSYIYLSALFSTSITPIEKA